ncbi:MAG: hypothetical protein P9M14_14860 [Candidatus Alcyoniella australis]|nr:hypothetical protein [Candidatus Alcyoniella australis]
MAKMMLIDTSKCTACRGCQVACKQWNQNKAVKTTFTGTYQNPPKVDGDTWTMVNFKEVPNGADYGINWIFTKQQCRHCADPYCRYGTKAGDASSESIIKDEATGAILFTDKSKGESLESVFGSCPYGIPTARKDGTLVKCNLCIDRISDGLLPACVQACPTGTLTFGDKDAMLAKAKARLAKVKAQYPKAKLYPDDDTHVKWILVSDESDHFS